MDKRILTGFSYTGYFLIGVIGMVVAPVLPFLIKDFGLSLAVAGALFPARAAGSFAGALLGGVLSDYFGRKPLVVAGCLLQAMGMAAIAATGSWYVALGLFVLTGLGGGFLNVSLNALIAEVNSHRRGAAMNTLHGIYGVGSLIGPMVVGLVLSWQFGWRLVFGVIALIWFLYGAMTIPLQYPASARSKEKQEGTKAVPIRQIALHPVFILLFLVSFIYNGAATGLVGWINTYLNQREFPILLGASMVSVFYVGLTAGRFTFRAFSDGLGYSRVILICALGSLVFYPLAAFSASPWFIALGVFLSGAFFSGLHPTGLAYANTLFPTAAGSITGLLSIAMSLGSMSVPWLIGLMADTMGFRPGLAVGFGMIVCLLIVALRIIGLERAGKATPHDTVAA